MVLGVWAAHERVQHQPGFNSFCDEVELLELAMDYRVRVQPQPPIQDGGVSRPEVVVEAEVTFHLVLFP